MAKGISLKITLPNVFTHSFKDLSINIKPREIRIRMTTTKTLINNKYIPKHIYNKNIISSTTYNIKKIYNKFNTFLKKFLK
jgi:hypothetical protein